MKDVKKLQDAWNGRLCSHPEWAKEYCCGFNTGDYICTQCGLLLTEKEYNDYKRENKKL